MGQTEIIITPLASGARTTGRNASSRTAFEIAIVNGYIAIAEALLKAGSPKTTSVGQDIIHFGQRLMTSQRLPRLSEAEVTQTACQVPTRTETPGGEGEVIANTEFHFRE